MLAFRPANQLVDGAPGWGVVEPIWDEADCELVDSAPTLRRSGVRLKTAGGPNFMAVDALRVGEQGRTRAFVRIAFGYGLVVALCSVFAQVPAWQRVLLYVGLAVAMSACVWLALKLRVLGEHTPRGVLATGMACLLAALAGTTFFGAFSPAAVVLPFGLYFFSLGQDRWAIALMAASCGIGYGLVATLELAGVVVGGMVAAASVAPRHQVIMTVMVEATIVATYLAARATRAASLLAVTSELERATNKAHRGMLCDEARRDIELAMSRGRMGRFTDEVLGSFRLGAVIGRGAMGEVYEAKHVGDASPAAVKLLKPALLRDPSIVRRFLREVKMAACLDIPSVARVYEVSTTGTPYIAMERLNGESLNERIARCGALSVREVTQMVQQVGAALDAAHTAGVVHRDIKPTNLFRVDSGDRVWKLLDFGVAKLMAAGGTLTEGLIVGTPAYMAPEQADGMSTPRSDLFALGAVVYRALTGEPPFSGQAWADTIYSVATTMPPRPSSLAALPEALDVVMTIALAKQPEDRFQTGHQFAMAFAAATRGQLDEVTAERAWAVLQKHPWGGRQPPSSRRCG